MRNPESHATCQDKRGSRGNHEHPRARHAVMAHRRRLRARLRRNGALDARHGARGVCATLVDILSIGGNRPLYGGYAQITHGLSTLGTGCRANRGAALGAGVGIWRNQSPAGWAPSDLGHGNPLRKTKVIVARRAGDGTRRHLRTTVWTPHANPSRLSLTQQSESSRTFSPFRPPRTIPPSKLSQGL